MVPFTIFLVILINKILIILIAMNVSCLWLNKYPIDIKNLKCGKQKFIFICLLKTIDFHKFLFYSLAMGLYILAGNTFSMDNVFLFSMSIIQIDFQVLLRIFFNFCRESLFRFCKESFRFCKKIILLLHEIFFSFSLEYWFVKWSPSQSSLSSQSTKSSLS